MATETASKRFITGGNVQITRLQWLRIALITALAAIVLVLAVQALALALWPEIAAFKPLDSYARSALFTLVPTLAATALFARLARTRKNPVDAFVKNAVVVLLVSFIPDYLLPVPNKTFLASSVAAVMHLVAALAITIGILAGYRQVAKQI